MNFFFSFYRLQGEPVNLREQQDAVEFFMSLFESLDEGLKALGHPLLMGATLGGCFSDQKICQGCPHRYSKDEPFSVFSVDIRNHSSLTDSLEQYVKGELLEGADAYHCDKCDKKVGPIYSTTTFRHIHFTFFSSGCHSKTSLCKKTTTRTGNTTKTI